MTTRMPARTGWGMVAHAGDLSYPAGVPAFIPLPEPSVEDLVAAVESACQITVTVRDLTGWLRSYAGELLLPAGRMNHQQQPVCARGFAPACVQHCRVGIGAALEAHASPHVGSCWKNVREVIVPMRVQGTLHGYLFAGAWRVPGPPPRGSWLSAWRTLPEWSDQRGTEIIAVLSSLSHALWAAAQRQRERSVSPTRADAIRQYIRTHARQGPSLFGVARLLGLSPSRTSHAVREACGMSLQELINTERIRLAQHLLSETADSLAVIGSAVGWDDAPHFSRMFRRATGLAPGQWRQRHRIA